MTVSSIESSSFPWQPLRTPPQGVVAQDAPDLQASNPVDRPALPPTQAQTDSDALFARQGRQEKPLRSSEDKGEKAGKAGKAHGVHADGAATAGDEDQQVELDRLKARDTEVRQHEAAHQAAGGGYTGVASFTYARGPDGARYAIGGEVSVDSSPIPGKPEATIAKMRIIQQAALAPAEPSAQDQRVAAKAARAILQAQAELLQQHDKARAQGDGLHDASYQQRAVRALAGYQAATAAAAAG